MTQNVWFIAAIWMALALSEGFDSGGTFTNYGTLTISNTGPDSLGFDNFGTVTNKDTIIICGSSGNGFVNESGSAYTGNPVTSCM